MCLTCTKALREDRMRAHIAFNWVEDTPATPRWLSSSLYSLELDMRICGKGHAFLQRRTCSSALVTKHMCGRVDARIYGGKHVHPQWQTCISAAAGVRACFPARLCEWVTVEGAHLSSGCAMVTCGSAALGLGCNTGLQGCMHPSRT